MPSPVFRPDVRNPAHRPSMVFIETENGWDWNIIIQYGMVSRQSYDGVFGSRKRAERKAAHKLARLQAKWDAYQSVTVVGNADLNTPLRPPLPPIGPGSGSRPVPPPPVPNRDLT